MKLIFLIFPLLLFSKNRLKDLITITGVRSNPLIGYGLVIGLNGTGDGGGEITQNSLKRMFNKLGLNPQNELSSKNVAAVIVSGKLPPFARSGQKIDVTISSIGESSSLAGGTLLATPIKGGDSKIYAIAQGPLSIGGLNKGAKFATTARIPGGATVEREIPLNFLKKNSLRLNLNISDFTTSHRIEKTINSSLGGKFAIAKDSTTIDLIIPEIYKQNIVKLMSVIENLTVEQDIKSKIIINERTGTVITGSNILLHDFAIGHGDLSIEVKNEDNEEDTQKHTLFKVNKGTTLNDLVKALNAIGITPEDLISILQALRKNGIIASQIEII